MHAQWTAITYDITVDTDGGSAVADQTYQISGAAQTKIFTAPTYQTTFTVSYDTQGGSAAPSDQTSTKPFSSWSVTTQPNGGTATFSNTTLTIPANAYGDMAIKANWGAQPSIQLPVAPTKNGYTFNGWYTAASCGGTKAGDANATRTPDQTRTLYACWEVVTYNITYTGNGGTLGGCTPTTYTVESSDITPNCTSKTRTGYTFSSFSPATIPAGSTGDKTITAQWSAIPYTITLNVNGGTAVTNPADYTINAATQTRTLSGTVYATDYTVSFDTEGGSANPESIVSTRPFNGWSFTTNSTPTSSVAGSTLTIASNAIGNIVLEAQW